MLLLLAFACTGDASKNPDDDPGTGADDTGEPADDGPDADDDGWPAAVDCDEDDAAINPGAAEHCDGVDEDCDGYVDDFAVDWASFSVDADADGFGGADDGAVFVGCEPPAGYGEAGDCDDGDPDVSPAGREIPGDGVDQDCDGVDTPDACASAPVLAGDWVLTGNDAASTAAGMCASGLARVGGTLEIASTDFTDLSALSCLCAVDGALVVHDNAALISFDGMPELRWLAGLQIHDNGALASLTGLTEARITGSVDIEAEDALTSLAGLYFADSIEALTVYNCDGLVSFDGGAGLEAITGTLAIQENDVLASLEGLVDLASIGSLAMQSNRQLTSLAGLDAVTTIEGELSLTRTKLASLDGLGNVTSIGSIRVADDTTLRDFAAMTSLRTVGGLELSNSALTSLSGFDFSGDFSLIENSALVEVDAPDVGSLGAVTIQDNDALVRLSLPALRQVSGDLYLYENDVLSELDLASLTQVIGTLTIDEDDALVSPGDLGALETVYAFTLSNNDAMTSLDGLDALRSDLGDMRIERNRALVDVSALHGVTRVGGWLYVRFNTALPTASAEALRDAIDTITSGSVIEGNGP